MTHTPREEYRDEPAEAPRLPSAISWLLFLSPLMIAAGAFVSIMMIPFVSTVGGREGDAITVTWIGVVVLCLGMVFLAAGIAVAGVRSLLAQRPAPPRRADD